MTLLLRAAVVGLACAVAVVGLFYWRERQARVQADAATAELKTEFQVAQKNEQVALIALAVAEATKHPVSAAKLALAAWPRDSSVAASSFTRSTGAGFELDRPLEVCVFRVIVASYPQPWVTVAGRNFAGGT